MEAFRLFRFVWKSGFYRPDMRLKQPALEYLHRHLVPPVRFPVLVRNHPVSIIFGTFGIGLVWSLRHLIYQIEWKEQFTSQKLAVCDSEPEEKLESIPVRMALFISCTLDLVEAFWYQDAFPFVTHLENTISRFQFRVWPIDPYLDRENRSWCVLSGENVLLDGRIASILS